MLKEKITLNRFLGILIGGIGAFFLVWGGNKSAGTSSILGNLLILSNATFYAFYLVYVQPLMKKYKPITVISWVFLVGLLFMIPFGITDVIATDFSAFTLNTYLVIAYVVIGTTFLTYLFNIYSLSKVSPSVNGSYIYLQPVVSFVMVSIYAFVLGKDEYAQDINLIKIISCLLVVAGVYLISKKDTRL